MFLDDYRQFLGQRAVDLERFDFVAVVLVLGLMKRQEVRHFHHLSVYFVVN